MFQTISNRQQCITVAAGAAFEFWQGRVCRSAENGEFEHFGSFRVNEIKGLQLPKSSILIPSESGNLFVCVIGEFVDLTEKRRNWKMKDEMKSKKLFSEREYENTKNTSFLASPLRRRRGSVFV